MMTEISETVKEAPKGENKKLAHRIDAAAWGLFFIWMGVALLLDVGLGVGLLGVAVIMLGEQVVRLLLRMEAEGFWIFVGSLFLISGIWELLDKSIPFVPILLILLGLAVIWKKVLPKKK